MQRNQCQWCLSSQVMCQTQKSQTCSHKIVHTCTLKTGNRNTKHVFQLVKWLTPESARQISVFMGISEIITWTKFKKKTSKVYFIWNNDRWTQLYRTDNQWKCLLTQSKIKGEKIPLNRLNILPRNRTEIHSQWNMIYCLKKHTQKLRSQRSELALKKQEPEKDR